ncbi:MAG: ABC transporter substrate-binding protein [Corynebacterium sp.]|nr:ABC transporter substrate-binding protein [Corynebacterium sp.]
MQSLLSRIHHTSSRRAVAGHRGGRVAAGHRGGRVAAGLAASALLASTLTACASWDEAPTSSVNEELMSSLEANGSTVDAAAARTLTGLTQVPELSEVIPITENPAPQLPVELTDADGEDVTVTDVSRILALDIYGTYTKTLRGLGLGDNIVGRTVSSTEPSLADLPVVTVDGHNINVEAVLNLKPTLVIVDHSIGPDSAITQIRDAGVTVVVMNPERSSSTITEDILNLASVVGLPEDGQKLADRAEQELADARDTIADIVPADDRLGMVFLYARGTGGIFFILADQAASDLITEAGGVDVAGQAGMTGQVPATAEALAGLNPDLFIMMTEGLNSTNGLDGLLARPGIAQTLAGQKSRVVALPDGSSLAFGPQTGELLLRLTRAAYLGEA